MYTPGTSLKDACLERFSDPGSRPILKHPTGVTDVSQLDDVRIRLLPGCQLAVAIERVDGYIQIWFSKARPCLSQQHTLGQVFLKTRFVMWQPAKVSILHLSNNTVDG